MINAGELNKIIELQDIGTGRGEDGSSSKDYSTTATVWAKITSLAGREFWAGKQVNSEITHTIVIRYRTGIKSTTRIKFGTRFFDVLSYNSSDEGNEDLILRCKEVLG